MEAWPHSLQTTKMFHLRSPWPELQVRRPATFDLIWAHDLMLRWSGVSAGMLLLYVVIPTIPLLLLILVASATCCFQMLSRR